MLPILLIMLVFGVTHSLLAGQNIKQAVRVRFGDRVYHGFYRITYNVIATLSLLPVMLIYMFYPGAVIWQAEGVLAAVFLASQAAGLIGLLVSLMQIDLGRFAGLSQLRAYFTGEPLPLPPESLQQGGVYRLVRHPLYLFSLMALWPQITMTQAFLAFNVATTAYFVVGSLLEERRMIASFGQVYLDYQARVPWLIPGVPLKR